MRLRVNPCRTCLSTPTVKCILPRLQAHPNANLSSRKIPNLNTITTIIVCSIDIIVQVKRTLHLAKDSLSAMRKSYLTRTWGSCKGSSQIESLNLCWRQMVKAQSVKSTQLLPGRPRRHALLPSSPVSVLKVMPHGRRQSHGVSDRIPRSLRNCPTFQKRRLSLPLVKRTVYEYSAQTPLLQQFLAQQILL